MHPIIVQSNADCQIPLGQQECSLKAQHKGYTMVVQHNVNSPYGCYEAHDSHVDGVFYNTESNTNGTCVGFPQYTCLCPGVPPSPPALPPPSPPGAPPFPPGHHIVCVQHASESDAQAACASKPDPNTCRVLPPDTKSINGNVFTYAYETVASTCEQLGLFSPNTPELCRDAHHYFGNTGEPIFQFFAHGKSMSVSGCHGYGIGWNNAHRADYIMPEVRTKKCNNHYSNEGCICGRAAYANWTSCESQYLPPSLPPPSPPPPNPPPPPCLPRNVDVTVVNNVYYFNGVAQSTPYSLGPGNYYFNGVPDSHPTTWFQGSNGATGWYNEDGQTWVTVENVNSISKIYRKGNLRLYVNWDFEGGRLDCYNHGDMTVGPLGLAAFVYNPDCPLAPPSLPPPSPSSPPSAPALPAYQWAYGATGQSCNDVCTDKGKCNINQMMFADVPALTWLHSDFSTNVPIAFGFSCDQYDVSADLAAPYTAAGTTYCIDQTESRLQFYCDTAGFNYKRMCLCGDAFAFVVPGASPSPPPSPPPPPPPWTEMGATGNMIGSANSDNLGTSVDINFDGTVIVAGAPGSDGSLVDNGAAKVFAWNDATSSWSQRGADVSGERGGDRAGSSVTINGDGTVFALGSWENDDAFTNAGQYQIFAWDETTSAWVQRGNDLEGPGGNSGKTASFSYDGSVIAIGSHYYNSGAGRVDVYQWDSVSSTWVPRGSPISSGAAWQPQSGWAVDLSHDGTTLVYTSPYERTPASPAIQGTARVVRWDGSAWVAKGLPIETQLEVYKFGTAVSINADGTVVAVTNFVDQFAGESSGHVAVYEWVEVASAWVQRGSNIACTTGSVTEDRMGLALNGDGTLLSIGEPTSASSDGRARVFHWDGSTWTQRGATVVPSSGEKALGMSVALSSSGNVMAVGAPWSDNGHVRAFRWSTPSPPPPP